MLWHIINEDVLGMSSGEIVGSILPAPGLSYFALHGTQDKSQDI